MPLSMEQLSEETLSSYITEISSGNEASLKCFYEENGRWMLAFIMSIVSTRESAEEVLQDVMMNIVLYGSKKPITNSKGWLFKVMVNAAKKKAKKESQMKETELTEEILAQQNESLELAENSADQIEALKFLDELEHQCVIMHIFGQMKLPQVAKLLDLPYNKVRNKYQYAIGKLKTYYQGRRAT